MQGIKSSIATKFNDSFCVLVSEFRKNEAKEIQTSQTSKKFVITYTITGDGTYKDDTKKIVPFKQAHTTITLFENTKGVRQIGGNLKQIRIILDEDFLLKNFKESIVSNYHKTNLNLINFAPTKIKSQILLKQLLNPTYKDEFQKVFLQSKALELICFEMLNLGTKPKIFLDSYDKKALFKAREILLQNMQNPPSIVELSKIVHLNEVKLKSGFKELFGQTPYQYLFTYKMQKAKKLLEKGELSVKQISKIIGYKFANNFTNAFYGEFKILPKDVLRMKTH